MADGISSMEDVYEPAYPAIGHIAGYGDEWSSTVGHTVELSESVWLVAIV